MGSSSASQLRAQGPVEILDGAFSVVRHGGFARLLRGFGAGFAPAAVVLSIYYLERVEGLRSLRPLMGIALATAWWIRCLVVSNLARAAALDLRPSLPMSSDVGRPLDVVCTASVFGLGLWMWLWPIAGMSMISPWAVGLLLPILSIRGAVAPSWLARASSARGRGLKAFGHAFDDTSGRRGVFTVVEFLILLGTVGLYGNVYALLGVGLLIGHSMLGLDVAFVSSFLSPENELTMLVVACTTLVLLEPLRAAVSAQAFVDARSRRDGADLHAAVDAAIEAGRQRSTAGHHAAPSAREIAGAAILVLSLGVAAAPALADRDLPPADPDHAALDAQVREHMDSILTSSDFTEFARRDTRSMQDVMQRFWDWLEELFKTEDPPDEDRGGASTFHLPIPGPAVLIGLALMLLIVVALYVASQKRVPPPRRAAAEDAAADPLDRPPMEYLDEAAALAAAGKPREALRALYLATLVSLDRSRIIRFEPAKTNWQYIRTMPRGDLRQLFSGFTRVFDYKWYGREDTDMEDYRRARELADRIVAMQERKP